MLNACISRVFCSNIKAVMFVVFLIHWRELDDEIDGSCTDLKLSNNQSFSLLQKSRDLKRNESRRNLLTGSVRYLLALDFQGCGPGTLYQRDSRSPYLCR